MSIRPLVAALAALILLGPTVGCGRDFEPYWRVDKLRLLAIKADPAVAQFNQPLTFSAAVFAPAGADIRYQWSWCPIRTSAQDGYECAMTAEDLGPMGSQLSLDLGQEPTATFLNPMSADQVKAFCELIVASILDEVDDPEMAALIPVNDCEQGFEISVRLQLETDDDSIIASKRLLLHGGSEEINENPRFTGVEIRPEDPEDLPALIDRADWTLDANTDHDDQWIPVTEDGSLTILSDVEFEIRALVDPESVQTYTEPPPLGQPNQNPQPREEALQFRYFVTTGTLRGSSGLYVPDANTLTDAAETGVSFSSIQIDEQCQEPESGACLVRIWSVVRDSRLGVDFIERSLLVVN